MSKESNKIAKNDVTGDSIKTKPTSELYRHNWEIIFGNKEKQEKEIKKNESSVKNI